MAELKPIPSAQRPSDFGYQPVSGYAVAAIITAGLFLVILLILVGYALSTRRAIFLWELLALPALGIILALVGRKHVRNSEGTKTGLRLANSALWVSVLGATGFTAYMVANIVVLERESTRTADALFKELKNGRPHHAFHNYVLPVEEQGRGDPNVPAAFEIAYAVGGYAQFKNHDLVRITARNGSAVEFEQLGVKDLGPAPSGFECTHLYRLTCPEGEFTVQLRLVAAETRKGSKTQMHWRIPADPFPNISVKPDKLSNYGRMVAELEQEGIGFVSAWLYHLALGRVLGAHLLTTPLAHRGPIESGLVRASALGGGAGILMPLRVGFLPAERRSNDAVAKAAPVHLSFEDLSQSGFFRADAAGSPLSSDRSLRLRGLWHSGPRMEPINSARSQQLSDLTPDLPVISITQDAVTVVVAADMALDTPMQFARCFIGVECRDPDLMAALNTAREQGGLVDDLSVSLRKLPARGWRVIWLRTDMEPHTMSSPTPAGGR